MWLLVQMILPQHIEMPVRNKLTGIITIPFP